MRITVPLLEFALLSNIRHLPFEVPHRVVMWLLCCNHKPLRKYMKPRRFGSYEWVLLINTFVDSGTGINFTNSLFLQSVILFTICKTTAFCSSLTPGIVNSRSNVSSGLKILIAASMSLEMGLAKSFCSNILPKLKNHDWKTLLKHILWAQTPTL